MTDTQGTTRQPASIPLPQHLAVMIRGLDWTQYWPVALAGVVLLVIAIDALLRSIDLNGGRFVYALDDAYIHMGMARNFAQHGTWGINAGAFASTTSSPLWTFLIAISTIVTGPVDGTPYAFNLLAALGALWAADHLLRRHCVPAVYRAIALLAVIILVPLNTLILTGMEHILQILLVLLFVDYATELVTGERAPLRSRQTFVVLALAALLSMVRYEGLFLVAAYGGFLLLRWRPLQAIVLGAAGAVPVILYGLLSLANDWMFLPASLIIKSDSATYLRNADMKARLQYIVVDTYKIMANQHVLSLLLLAALALMLFRYYQTRRVWDRGIVLLAGFVLVTLANVRFVSWPLAGTYSRYEAYLVALALIAIPAALGAYLPRRLDWRAIPIYAAAGLLIAFVMNDIWTRYEFIAYDNPAVTGTNDVYLQQMQMAEFLRTYYDDAVVAANDIGAINYYADIETVDLWGLGTVEVTRARQDNRYSTDVIREVTAAYDTQIAVVYDTWYDAFGGLPEEWLLVGQWRMERAPIILGYHTVSFYAVNPDAAEALAANLTAYSDRLPAGIAVELAAVGSMSVDVDVTP